MAKTHFNRWRWQELVFVHVMAFYFIISYFCIDGAPGSAWHHLRSPRNDSGKKDTMTLGVEREIIGQLEHGVHIVDLCHEYGSVPSNMNNKIR